MPFGFEGVRIVHGFPGSGKTTRIARIVDQILAQPDARVTADRVPVAVLSLTRAAAAEAAGRNMPLPREAISTLHSVGFRSLDGANVRVIEPADLREWNRCFPACAIRLGVFARTDRCDPEDDLFGDDEEEEQGGDVALQEYELLRHRLVPRERWPLQVRAFSEQWERWKAESGLIDFTDMIERGGPHRLDPGVLIVDEAQDLSALEHGYLRRLRRGGEVALILVGDSDQSIYTWRGADPRLLLDPSSPPDHVEALSQSYRLPASVLRRGSAWLEQLPTRKPIPFLPRRERPDDPASAAVEGGVERCDATWSDPGEAIDIAERSERAGKSVLLLATTNRMTGPMCAVMRERGLPFSNPWRRRDRLWNPLLSSLARGASVLLNRMESPWTHAELGLVVGAVRDDGLLRDGARAEILVKAGSAITRGLDVRVDDLERWFEHDALVSLVAALDGTNSDESVLRWWGAQMPVARRGRMDYLAKVVTSRGRDALSTAPRIHPSTIHASKGGEADIVFLFPDISRAAMDAWLDGGEGRDSIVRTFYVGITRARETLYICEAAGRSSVDL